MTRTIKVGTAAILLLASAGFAAAQPVLALTPEQQVTIYRSITREPIRTEPPAGWNAKVGVRVPSTVELYDVPATVAAAPVRHYRYTILNNQVVLVEPSTRRVVQILSK
jgi:hypothetical protein